MKTGQETDALRFTLKQSKLSKNFTAENSSRIAYVVSNDSYRHFSIDFWNTIAFSNPDFKLKRGEYFAETINKKVDLDSRLDSN